MPLSLGSLVPRAKENDDDNGTDVAGRFQRSSSLDVWFADVDQMWLEFVVAGSGGISERYSRRRTVPFVDNFPLMAWMSRPSADGDVGGPTAKSSSSAAAAAANSASQTLSQTFCAVVRVGTKDVKAQVGGQCSPGTVSK